MIWHLFIASKSPKPSIIVYEIYLELKSFRFTHSLSKIPNGCPIPTLRGIALTVASQMNSIFGMRWNGEGREAVLFSYHVPVTCMHIHTILFVYVDGRSCV